MKKLNDHAAAFQQLKSFALRLNGMIEDGSFYRLPFTKRFRLIRRVKKLYNRLRGPVADVKLKHLLAATAVSLLVECSLDLGSSSNGIAIARFTVPAAVGNMERYELTVSGAGMAATQVSYPGNSTNIVLQVPAGAARQFEMLAVVDPSDSGSIRRYRGVSTVDLEPGTNVNIALTMEVLPLEPGFKAPVMNPFGVTGISYHANPVFADLDGDGDLDLLVNDYLGYYMPYGDKFLYFQNTGTAGAPVFAAPVANPFGLTGITDYAAPALVDLDGDSDLDLLAGDKFGDFYYFENTGSASAPAFAAPVQNPFGLTYVVDYAVPAFADLDGDGDLDLLVGGNDTYLWYFENTAL